MVVSSGSRLSGAGLPMSPSSNSTLSSLQQSAAAGASNGVSDKTTITSVQVAVRIRPLTSQDQTSIPTRWQKSCIHPTSMNSLQVDASGPPPPGSAPTATAGASGREKKHNFNFDRVLGPSDGQDAVYRGSVQSLVPKFLEGYNVTVLAYGQTSSGKSYTMGTASSDSIDFEGLVAGKTPDPEMGIIPRAVAQLFDAMNAAKAKSGGSIQYTLKASFIEIYNEDLIDLFADADGDARPLVQIREDKLGHIFWSGLREVKVNNVADVMNYLVQGSARKYLGGGSAPPPVSGSAMASSSLTAGGRTTPNGVRASMSGLPRPSSAMGRQTPTGIPTPGRSRTPSGINPTRSQSPAFNANGGVERAHAPSGSEGEWSTAVSKFHFVDLAGSERLKRTAAQGERVREGISINSGLHALGNVISALGDPVKAKKTTHIPYRDSKLTRLLQDSLGGNAFTLMIACVSPTEYNVYETINTLQYANRARNIKNKAELNEQEIGWDDLDYLQGQVTKLRKELAVLKSSKGSGTGAALRGIADDDALKHAQATMREERANLSDLRQQVARLKSENVKLGKQLEDTAGGGKETDFLQAAEPIIVEYEKAIDVLEGQINLMKAALAHSEDIITDHENTILDTEQKFHSTFNELQDKDATVMELQARLAQLQDRESSANTYATELEARLQSYSSQEDSDANITNELRKEVVRLRQAETSAEAYIKELESRLLSSDTSLSQLTAQVERLERELERRDEQYKELQNRLQTLDATAENKALLEELDAREQRVLELEKRLDEVVSEKDNLAREKGKLTDTIAKDQLERGKVEDRLRTLEKSAVATPAAALALAVASSEPASAAVTSETDAQLRQHQSELLLLRDSHAKYLAELSTVQVRHREALQEIEKLTRQLTEAKLTGGKSAEHEEEMEELSPSQTDEDGDSNRLGTPRRRDSWQVSPSRAGFRRPESLRIDSGSPIANKLQRRSSGSFLGYKPADSPSEARDLLLSKPTTTTTSSASAGDASSNSIPNERQVRARSLSSGQPFVGEFSRGPRPLSLSGTVPPSPAFKATEPDSPANYERKILSLEKERDQLQSILKEREDELDAVQRSAPTTVEAVSLSAELAEMKDSPSEPRTPASSQAVESQLSDLQHMLAQSGNAQQSLQVQELLRAVAKKEAAHRDLVDSLRSELESLRAHAASGATDPPPVSRDLEDNHQAAVALLSTKHADALVQQDNAHTKALEAKTEEHKAALEGLVQQHEKSFKTQTETHNSAMQAKAKEYEAALAQQEASLREEHAAALKVKADEHEATLAEQAKDHASALTRLGESHTSTMEALAAEHKAALAKLADAHLQTTASRNTEHEQNVSRLQEEHSRALAWKDEQHASSLRSADMEQQSRAAEGQEEKESILGALKSEHTAQLDRAKAEYEASMERALNAAHDAHQSSFKAAVTASLADAAKAHEEAAAVKDAEYKKALAELTDQHAAALATRDTLHSEVTSKKSKDLQDAHELAQNALLAKHESALAELRAEHAAKTAESAAEHDAKLKDLTAAQATEHEAVKSTHGEELARVKAEYEETIADLVRTHHSKLENLEDKHNDAVNNLRDEHSKAASQLAATAEEQHTKSAAAATAANESHAKAAAEATAALQQSQESLAALKAEHESCLRQLTAEHEDKVAKIHAEYQLIAKDRDNLRDANTEFEKRHRLLQSQLEVDPVEMDMLKAELAETSDALVVLEGALTEAQSERDHMATELAVLRESMDASSRGLSASDSGLALAKELETQRSLLMQAKNDLVRSKADLQAVSEERNRQDITLRELQMKLAASESRASKTNMSPASDSSPVVDGPILNGVKSNATLNARHSGQVIEELSDTPRGSGFARSAAATAGPAAAVKPPPPTPPPNMPPPPTPTNGSIPTMRSSLRSSSSSTRHDRSDSEGNLTRSSSNASLSNGSSSTVPQDPRTAKMMAEQMEEMQKLTKQLAHCEADLQANIDLVATLEAALNDSERNLRKSRVQLAEISRERDRFSSQADELQAQIKTATAEVERVRSSVILEKQDYESKIQQERAAKEKAKEALEARLEEASRKKHASRLFCM